MSSKKAVEKNVQVIYLMGPAFASRPHTISYTGATPPTDTSLPLICWGGNGYIWKITHNIIHQTHANIHKHNEDL